MQLLDYVVNVPPDDAGQNIGHKFPFISPHNNYLLRYPNVACEIFESRAKFISSCFFPKVQKKQTFFDSDAVEEKELNDKLEENDEEKPKDFEGEEEGDLELEEKKEEEKEE